MGRQDNKKVDALTGRSVRHLSLADVSVASVMVKEVRSVPRSEQVASLLKLMSDHDIGSVVVSDGGRPVGIFTERDLLHRAASNPDSLKLTAEEVMTRPVFTISPKATIWEAITVMAEKKVRRLVVVDGDRIVGIITERDIIRAIAAQQNLLLEGMAESLPPATRERVRVVGTYIGPGRPR